MARGRGRLVYGPTTRIRPGVPGVRGGEVKGGASWGHKPTNWRAAGNGRPTKERMQGGILGAEIRALWRAWSFGGGVVGKLGAGGVFGWGGAGGGIYRFSSPEDDSQRDLKHAPPVLRRSNAVTLFLQGDRCSGFFCS